jgi:hypothetical protein
MATPATGQTLRLTGSMTSQVQSAIGRTRTGGYEVKNHNPAPAAKSSTDSSDATRGLAQAETRTSEESEAPSKLDPFTASASFRWDAVRDNREELEFFSVLDYYWYDPDRVGGQAVDDHSLRRHHPEIGDDEWRQLFCQAFMRGEADFARGRDAEARRALEEYQGRVSREDAGAFS